MNSDAHDDLPTQLDTLIDRSSETNTQENDHLSGTDLGPFRIRRKLGEGGMGQVYLARQMHPVERDVALKLILRKVQDRRALARFEIEQQALAQMSHPAIAQVFDAGTTPSGYPYFAMEFVDGEPLDHYCLRHRLNLDERLKLLIRICNGVQHAHQRGIIHRDLKPANILVTTIDGEPTPKIIDFGIARATENQAPDAAARDIVGTPQYMSPEQFSLDQIVLDSRSDVYSLGVVLHELLVGCPPIKGDRLSHVDSQTLTRVFAEFDPLPAPSTRLGADATQDRELSVQRRTKLRTLRKRLKRDLDAITLKALAQDREQRYTSAQALGDDLIRALDNYPVSAVADTAGYRARRFVQRNTLAVGSASAIALALVAGLTAATIGMVEAQRQYQIAEQRQNDLELVTEFQQNMLEALDPQNMGLSILRGLRDQYADSRAPDQLAAELAVFEELLTDINATDLARQVVDEQLLSQARSSIEQQFDGQPLLQADLFESIAAVYLAIGRPEAGLELRGEVLKRRTSQLPANDIDVLKARGAYGYAFFENDQLEDAETTLEALMQDIDVTDPQAQTIFLTARNDLALVRVDQGRIDEALELIENPPDFSERVQRDNAEVDIEINATRGYVLARARRIGEALIQFQRVLDLTKALRGPDAPSTLRAMMNVSAALGATGQHREALEIESDLLQRLYATVGREHISSVRIMSNMANNLRRVGREEEALALLVEAEVTSRAVLGPLSPVAMRIRLNLGSLMTHLGQLDSAYEILEAVVDDRTRTFGPDHPETLSAIEVRVSNLRQQGRYAEGLEMIDRVITGRAEAFGDDHRLVSDTRWLKALLQRDAGQIEEALSVLQPQAESDFDQAPREDRTLSRAVDLYHALLLANQDDVANDWFARSLAWLEASDADTLSFEQQQIRTRLLELPTR